MKNKHIKASLQCKIKISQKVRVGKKKMEIRKSVEERMETSGRQAHKALLVLYLGVFFDVWMKLAACPAGFVYGGFIVLVK